MPGIELVITQTGIDGSRQAMELLSHPLFEQRAHAAVDDIARYQDEIRLFGIDHIHPASQFLARIVIAQMKVGGHHHLVCLGQRLGSLQFQRHAYLIIIVEVAIEEEAEDEHEDAQGRIAVMTEESLRHEVNQTPQIEHKKHDDQIEHHEDGRCAYLIEQL